jgi:hypothetical protein
MAATNKTSHAVLIAALCVVHGAGAAKAWDDQYLDRMDKITFGAGNAVAHNIAVQTIDPWPAYVRNDHINIDGRRIALGHRRYQANRSLPPRGLSTSGLTFTSSTPGTAAVQSDTGPSAEQGVPPIVSGTTP